MSDLISRQAAIDALIEWYGCEPSSIGAYEDIIEKLPSAQSDDEEEANYWHEKANSYEQTLVKLAQSRAEQPEIIRCKECIDYPTDWGTSYSHRRYCATTRLVMPEDGFCSYAERREE